MLGVVVAVVCSASGNLAAHWSFDRETEASVPDVSGHDHPATLVGGAERAEGALGRALELDGLDDAATLGPGLFDGWGAASIAAWVRPSAGGEGRWRTLIAKGTGRRGKDAHLLWLGFNAQSGVWLCKLTTNEGETHRQGFMASVALDHWVHVTYVVDIKKRAIRLYVNGERRASFTNLDWRGTRLATHVKGGAAIGMVPGDQSGRWVGRVDEVRVYRGALTKEEVAAIYAASPPPPAPPRPEVDPLSLVAHWTFAYQKKEIAVLNEASQSGQYHGGLTAGARRAAGRVGEGLELNGRGDAMRIKKPAELFDAWNAVTVAAWVKPRKGGKGSWPTLIEKASGAMPKNMHILWVGFSRGSGRWAFQLATDLDENHFQSFETRVRYNVWSHVAIVINLTARTARLYVDGALAKEVLSLPLIGARLRSNPEGECAAGMIAQGKNNYFTGRVDELRVYRGVLSAAAIASLAGGQESGVE